MTIVDVAVLGGFLVLVSFCLWTVYKEVVEWVEKKLY